MSPLFVHAEGRARHAPADRRAEFGTLRNESRRLANQLETFAARQQRRLTSDEAETLVKNESRLRACGDLLAAPDPVVYVEIELGRATLALQAIRGRIERSS